MACALVVRSERSRFRILNHWKCSCLTQFQVRNGLWPHFLLIHRPPSSLSLPMIGSKVTAVAGLLLTPVAIPPSDAKGCQCRREPGERDKLIKMDIFDPRLSLSFPRQLDRTPALKTHRQQQPRTRAHAHAH